MGSAAASLSAWWALGLGWRLAATRAASRASQLRRAAGATGDERARPVRGYASLFGQLDLARDIVEPGAFAASLGRRGAAGIRMLFQHDPGQPVGVWTDICEDARGLFVRGRLAGGVARARELAELMRRGRARRAVDRLPHGEGATRRGSGVRRILEADLWEISIVTFPMLPRRASGAVNARLLRARHGPQLERTSLQAIARADAELLPTARNS